MADFHNPTATTADNGQETYTYEFYKRAPVGIIRDSFSKTEAGMIQMSGSEDVSLTTRYDDEIGYNTRVYWNNTWYRITKVDNVMSLNHQLDLTLTTADL